MSSRPYSATDVSANLHNKVSKAAAAKFLKEMHERKEIEGRAFGKFFAWSCARYQLSESSLPNPGKQLVYHALQDAPDEATPDDFLAMEELITTQRDEILAAKAREKVLRSELAAFSNILSTTELQSSVAAMESERTALQGRLAALQAGDTKPVSNEERLTVETAWTTWQRHTSMRKKICKDMWERCTEVLPDDQTREELWVCVSAEAFRTIC